MNLSVEEEAKVLLNEAFMRRNVIVGLFFVISLTMLGLGVIWPKVYYAYTDILVDERNIIRPLMEGAAVPTSVTDRSRMAREVLFGRKIMNEMLKEGGWLEDEPTPSEQEKLIEQIKQRTVVTNIRQNLLRIAYRDDDPQRAFDITKKYAELFVSESLEVKSAESQAAFDFIDKQVQEYHRKLVDAESNLKEFRSENLDARAGSEGAVGDRIQNLLARIEQTNLELKETEIKEKSLKSQLSGEAVISASLTREGQYRTRIAELQSQLDTLSLSYYDSHPDIVRIKHQIEDLKEAIKEEAERREQAEEAAQNRGETYVDDSISLNPLYQELRSELSQTKTAIETLKTRLEESKHLLETELERARRIHDVEATLAELTRDYEVNRDIYQDLLRRRENARVSMNLDRERQGLSFKIQEPAHLPLHPSGLRFMHFMIVGVFLGIFAPVAFIFVIQRFDPRVRSASVISEKLSLPVIEIIPHISTPKESRKTAWSIKILILILGVNIAIYGVVAWIKFIGVI